MQRNKKLKILFLPARYPYEKNPVAGIFIRVPAKAVALYNDVTVLYSEGCDKNLKKRWSIISDKDVSVSDTSEATITAPL